VIIGAIFWFIFGGEPVIAYKVIRQDAVKGITVTGTVTARDSVNISPRITARIKKLFVKENDYVKQGELLAILDDTQARGELESARGTLQQSQANLQNVLTEPRTQNLEIARAQVQEAQALITTEEQELQRRRIELADAISNESRLRQLYSQGAVSFREYEQARLQRSQIEQTIEYSKELIKQNRLKLQQARENLSLVQEGAKTAEIEEARARVQSSKGNVLTAIGNLEDYKLYSPVDGYVATLYLDPGNISSPTEPIFRIITNDRLKIEAIVEEDQLDSVRLGQKVYIVFDAYPDKIFSSKIIEVIQDVDPITGTFTIETGIPKSDKTKFVSGMTSDVTIVVNEMKNILIVPSDFVNKENGRQFVFVEKNGITKKTYITAKTFDNNRTRIIHGLKEGDIIVKSTHENKKLRPSQRIKIQEYYKQNSRNKL